MGCKQAVCYAPHFGRSKSFVDFPKAAALSVAIAEEGMGGGNDFQMKKASADDRRVMPIEVPKPRSGSSGAQVVKTRLLGRTLATVVGQL